MIIFVLKDELHVHPNDGKLEMANDQVIDRHKITIGISPGKLMDEFAVAL